jgi:hypothetical protein
MPHTSERAVHEAHALPESLALLSSYLRSLATKQKHRASEKAILEAHALAYSLALLRQYSDISDSRGRLFTTETYAYSSDFKI